MRVNNWVRSKSIVFRVFFCISLFFISVQSVSAAGTLFLSPPTGVYTAGKTFVVRVLADTGGQSINAAEGAFSFNNSELSVVGVSRANSIFNLWTTEPSFSNSAGTITFGGGSPKGYTGNNGRIMSVTFRALKRATTKVNFTSGVILAADGRGTNIIDEMKGGVYTLQAKATTPIPEYIAPPNTPGVPRIHSRTHPDQNAWYANNNVEINWNISSDITNVRLTADDSPYTTPVVFYDSPITGKVLDQFDEGAWYFHVQFKNENGWGRIAHFAFNIDTEKPESFTITKIKEIDPTDPRTAFTFEAVDRTSGVSDYEIQIDGGDVSSWQDDGSGIYKLESVAPGEHTMIVKALDKARNHLIETISFTIDALVPPRITDYPEILNSGGILVVRGETLREAQVTIYFGKKTDEPRTFTITSDEEGKFTFIMDEKPTDGVYRLWAEVTDIRGAKSGPSEQVSILVQPGSFLRIGSIAISYLSIIIPLLALLILLILLLLYSLRRVMDFRRRVRREVTEAEAALVLAFSNLRDEVKEHLQHIEEAKNKRDLTLEEARLAKSLGDKLQEAEKGIGKELKDIRKLRMK